MNRFADHSPIHRSMTLLAVVLVLLAGWIGPAQAMRGPASLISMVICSEGDTRTIWLDAAGEEQPAPDQCCGCPDCALPNLLAAGTSLPARLPGSHFAQEPARQAAQRGDLRPVSPVRTRGPPIFTTARTVMVLSPQGGMFRPDSAQAAPRGIRAIAREIPA